MTATMKGDLVRSALLTLIALALVFLAIQGLEYYVEPAIVFAIEAAFLLVGSAALLIVGARRNWAPHWCFLVIWLTTGLLCLVFIPPNSTPDFCMHYYRAYEISEGHLFSAPMPGETYWEFPENVPPAYFQLNPELSYVFENAGLTVDPETMTAQNISFMAVYTPLPYLPSVVGLLVAKPFTMNTWALIYASRISSFLICGALLFVIVRATPAAKPVIALTALLPLCVEIGAAQPSDITTMCALFGLFAYVFWLRAGARRVSLVVLTVLLLVVALVKVVYLPVCLLALLVPKESFPRPGKVVILVVLAVVCAAASLLWVRAVSVFLIESNPGVDSAAQVQGMLNDPLGFVAVLGRTIVVRWRYWLLELFGGSLNALNVVVPTPVPVAMALVFAFACVRSCLWNGLDGGTALAADGSPGGNEPSACPSACVRGWERVLLLFIFLVVFLLTLTSLYVQWTPVANDIVVGFQGRYLAPILPFLVLALFPHETGWQPRITWVAWLCLLVLEFTFPLAVAL